MTGKNSARRNLDALLSFPSRPAALFPSGAPRLLRSATLAGVLGCVAYLGAPVHAHAATPQDRAAADALFDSGVTLMEAGNYDKACPKFQKSFDLDPGVGTLLNLGRCYDLAGKYASAWSTYRDASAMARQEGQTAREEHARAEAKKMEPKLVRVQLELAEGLRELPGFKLTQDGVELVVDAVVGEAIPVDAGSHEVVAQAEGYLPRTVKFEAKEEGTTYPVFIDALEQGAAAPPPAAEPAPVESAQPKPAPEPSPTPAAEPKGRSLAGPIILGAVGVGLAGAGTAFAFMAKGHDNKARDICTGDDECGPKQVDDWNDEIDKAKSNATIAYIGWGVGGAAITGAVIWLIAGGSSGGGEKVGAPSPGKMELTPVVGGNVWGLTARGAF
jgi:hypothetical protein